MTVLQNEFCSLESYFSSLIPVNNHKQNRNQIEKNLYNILLNHLIKLDKCISYCTWGT